MKRLRRTLAGLAIAGLAITAAACGSSSGSGEGIVVGGADFTESKVLAEIYAGALKAKGIEASTKPDIGQRERYLGALKDGSVDVFPEYTGNLALYYDNKAKETSAQAWYDLLKKKLPSGVVALDMAPAENNDSVTVSKETASKNNLKKISDLTPLAKTMVFGAPPEFKDRPQGIPGLKSTYGLTFKTFKPMKGALLVNGLVNGQVQAANIFTTDPAIYKNGFVVLEDDKHLFPVNNIVPIANKDSSKKVSKVLNAVSAKLTTKGLSDLDKQVDVDKKPAAEVAQSWLKANGFAS